MDSRKRIIIYTEHILCIYEEKISMHVCICEYIYACVCIACVCICLSCIWNVSIYIYMSSVYVIVYVHVCIFQCISVNSAHKLLRAYTACVCVHA